MIRIPVYAPNKSSSGRPVIERWEESYVGCVLAIYERNGRDDSDFYAMVWDEAEQTTKSVEYATTRAYTYDNCATVDATPAVLSKVRQHLIQVRYPQARADAERRAKAPVHGDKVTVLKGKKSVRGSEGEVFWVRQSCSPFGGGLGVDFEYRLGLRLADGSRIFVNSQKCSEPADWRARLEPEESTMAQVQADVERTMSRYAKMAA